MVDLYAVSIDDVRAMFGADAGLAAELTGAAQAAFPAPTPRPRPFLPLMRRPREFRVDPAQPTREDLTRLLAGGFVPPERMAASWKLFRALLEHRAARHSHVEMDAHTLEAAEFDLARHGLDSYHCLRKLGERPLGIPLHGRPDAIDGYAKHVHVVGTRDALREVLPGVDDATRAIVEPVLEVCETAAERGLDVVTLTS